MRGSFGGGIACAVAGKVVELRPHMEVDMSNPRAETCVNCGGKNHYHLQSCIGLAAWDVVPEPLPSDRPPHDESGPEAVLSWTLGVIVTAVTGAFLWCVDALRRLIRRLSCAAK